MTAFLIGTQPADLAPSPDGAPSAGWGARRPAPQLRLALFTDTFTPQVNGVTRTLDRLLDAVYERGGAARVYTAADPAAPPVDDVRRFPGRALWGYPRLRVALPPHDRVAADLRAWGATLVHAATPFGVGVAGRRAAHALGLPLVTSYHTHLTAAARHYGLGALGRAGWPYLRWFHNGGLRTLCPTATVADELAARGFRDTAVWGRGVDAARFHPRHRSAAMRKRLGAEGDALVVAYVGRLAREKGVDVLLGAARRVAAESARKVVFAFAGDGPEERRCRDRAPAGAVFTGALSGTELSEFYASADLFVFPSATDTFGNVVLEAMASRLPVLAVDAGSARELLGDGRGALVRPHDPAILAMRMLWLLENPDARERLAARALAHARSQSWGTVFDGLFAEYDAARAVHRAHRAPRLAARRHALPPVAAAVAPGVAHSA